MTSPTKNKTPSKNNADMLALQEINAELSQKLQTTLDFLTSADVKIFINDPSKLSILLLSKEAIEDIEKLLLTSQAEKIQASLYAWQTELIFHYNRLLGQVKSQPHVINIAFLKQNYAVDLMRLFPLTPRKRARLEAREKKELVFTESEELQNTPTQLSHYKSTVARKLRFDDNGSVKSDSVIELTTDMSKAKPGC